MSFFKKLKTDIEGNEKPETVLKEKPSIEEKNEKSGKKEPLKSKSKKISQDWMKSEGQLAVDVYQTNSDFYVTAPIAGVDPENIDVFVENGMLVIKGERKSVEEIKEKDYFYQECYWGSFSRQILLPEDADANRIKAGLKKGVLTVKIPRVTKLQKRKINILSE